MASKTRSVDGLMKVTSESLESGVARNGDQKREKQGPENSTSVTIPLCGVDVLAPVVVSVDQGDKNLSYKR
jgi:hypothetical protein